MLSIGVVQFLVRIAYQLTGINLIKRFLFIDSHFKKLFSSNFINSWCFWRVARKPVFHHQVILVRTVGVCVSQWKTIDWLRFKLLHPSVPAQKPIHQGNKHQDSWKAHRPLHQAVGPNPHLHLNRHQHQSIWPPLQRYQVADKAQGVRAGWSFNLRTTWGDQRLVPWKSAGD